MMANYLIWILIPSVFLAAIDCHPCSTRDSRQDVCLEPRCIQTAASILSVMDLAADPCQDFYQYACGKYAEAKDIPPGNVQWNPLNELQVKNRNIQKKLLDRDGYEIQGVHSEALRKAKIYLQTCLNETHADAVGANPLLDLIEATGGWSLLDGTRAGRRDVPLGFRLAVMYKVGAQAFFGLVVAADDVDPTIHTAQFQQAGLTHYIPAVYANKNATKIQGWFEFGASVMTLLREPDGNEEFARMKEEARAIMDENFEFEKSLSKIFVPSEKLSNYVESYNKMPLRKLIASAPDLDLQTYMNEIFGREIDPDLEVVVYTPSYFRKLNNLIRNTPPRVLENYYMWYATQFFVDKLSEPYQDARFEYYRASTGASERPVRATRCLREADNKFGYVTGALFVEEVAFTGVKNKTVQMIHYIKDAFRENLQHVNWMDEKVRGFTEEKLLAVTEKIGYPDWILNSEKLDEYYSDLPISTNSWLENALNRIRDGTRKMLERLWKPVDKQRWDLQPSDVNAAYDFSQNQMTFPLGILQPPFFSSDRPMSMNFGGIGMIMGHELTHGFDTRGRQFDGYGRLNTRPMSVDAYDEKAACMETQYSQYQVYGHNLNGKKTLNENIADNGGYKLAYRAYQKWRESNADDIRLPLKMTTAQEFFVAASQVWCSFYTPEVAIQEIPTLKHTNNKYRVIGPLSNMATFSEAFACPAGSPMNPVQKCEVW